MIFLAGWVVIFCGIRTAQHFSFGTNANDLSVYDYGLHSTLKGRVMAEPFHQYSFGRWEKQGGTLSYEPGPVKGWHSYFELHFSAIVLLFVPVYAVLPGSLLLLYLQVLAVGLSALFLFLIARSLFSGGAVPWLVAIIFLFFRQTLIGLMHDFHPELLFPPLLLGAYYFLAVRKKRPIAFAFLLLALLVKEDVGLYLFFFGLFAAFKLKEKRFGMLTSATALVYTLVVLGLIIPAFRHQSGGAGFYQYGATYGQAGGSLFGIVGHVLGHPAILFQGIDFASCFRILLLGILLPLLFIPLFSSYGLLLVPPLAVAIFSKIPQFYTFGLFYSATLLPFLFLALIFGLKNIRDWTARLPGRGRSALTVIGLVLLLANLGNSSFWRIIQPGRYRALSTYADFQALIKQIPSEASVAAQSALIPHLPKREAIDMLPGFQWDDFVVVHGGVNLWPYTREEFANFVRSMDESREYELAGRRGEVRLYRRLR